ncbi:MAG TPA: PQQ-dependent sugar dehydrogenase [Phycisphaerales bacterium]|nr:PQQ-dependent sugar dehydrogenase [Phycisphaerales bacterium]
MQPFTRPKLSTCALTLWVFFFLCHTNESLAQTLSSTPIASGLSKPVCVTYAPGDFSRLFVVEQTGKIKIIMLDTNTVLTDPFLDVGSLINSGLEYGLLSLVFHPNYQQNGIFYIYYTTSTGNADPFIARYHVSSNPNIADSASASIILHIPYTISSHRAGWMGFGPDGYLYVSTGDGGEQDPQNNASNLAVLKGKILRLDVNGPDGIPGTADDDGFPADNDRNYRIPRDNPFLSTPGAAPELWAYGLRNPWRCSMDRLTHDLWIGDVGQSAREEVDFRASGSGGAFFGWRCLEGTLPTNYAGCPAPESLPPSTLPIYEYSHAIGASVIGGYVYRGCAIPWLQGTYVFGDWGGKAFSFRYTPQSGLTEFADRTAELSLGSIFSSFGEDAFGELYVCNWSNGFIRKIIPAAFIGPDCNNNGRNDACDILAGISADANHNGVPDECDPPPPLCPGDVNHSGAVNIDDLTAIILNWGATGPNIPADVTNDGVVNIDDLTSVILHWGNCS